MLGAPVQAMANSVYYCHECAQAVDVLIVTTHSPTHSSTSLRCRRCGGEFVELIASPSPSAASSAAPASALEGALGAAASTVPPSAPTSSTRPASSLSASAALARDGAVLYAESDALHVPPYLVSLEPTAVASTTRAAASTSAAPSPSVAAPPGDPAASSAASSSWGLLSDVAAVIGCARARLRCVRCASLTSVCQARVVCSTLNERRALCATRRARECAWRGAPPALAELAAAARAHRGHAACRALRRMSRGVGPAGPCHAAQLRPLLPLRLPRSLARTTRVVPPLPRTHRRARQCRALTWAANRIVSCIIDSADSRTCVPKHVCASQVEHRSTCFFPTSLTLADSCTSLKFLSECSFSSA